MGSQRIQRLREERPERRGERDVDDLLVAQTAARAAGRCPPASPTRRPARPCAANSITAVSTSSSGYVPLAIPTTSSVSRTSPRAPCRGRASSSSTKAPCRGQRRQLVPSLVHPALDGSDELLPRGKRLGPVCQDPEVVRHVAEAPSHRPPSPREARRPGQARHSWHERESTIAAVDGEAAARAWVAGWTRAGNADADGDRRSVHARTRVFRSLPVPEPEKSAATTRVAPSRTRNSSSAVFGEPVVAGDRAAVEYWAVLSADGDEETLAGIALRAVRAGRQACSSSATTGRWSPAAARRTFRARYFAYSIARDSRITVTLIWPGYSRAASISRAISCESSTAWSSSISSGLTITRISRPAWSA